MNLTAPEVLRDYKFSDGTLEQLADLVKANITRDLADLAPRGITAGTITALQLLRDTFSDSPTDTEARGLTTSAVEVKNAARKDALLKATQLRTAAQNVFDEKSGKYKRFGFAGMDNLKDNDLPRALKRMKRTGNDLLTELAPEGIDATFITDFTTTIESFDDELENVDLADEERDKLAEERAEKGNALYKEVVRLCNIGKNFYAPISEAKYNDYVIERFVGTVSEEDITVVLEGDVISPGIETLDVEDVHDNPDSTVTIEITESPMGIFATDDPNGVPTGTRYDLTEGSTTTITTAEFKTLIGWSPTKQIVRIQNIGMVPGHYKITFHHLSAE